MKKISYSGIFFDPYNIIEVFEPIFPNVESHHSTIEVRPDNVENLDLGKKIKIKITGRLTTNRVDLLLVDNNLSKKKNPHITLSVAKGFEPSISDSEILNNLDKIKPINNMYIDGIIGYFQNGEVIPDYNKPLSIYNKMNLNKIVESEFTKIKEEKELNESLKTIFGGAALMYALTFPSNIGATDSKQQNKTEYSSGEFKQKWEYDSKYSVTQLSDIMKKLQDNYSNRVYYTIINANNVEEGIEKITNSNKGIAKLPYKLVAEKIGSSYTLHILSGNKKILNYFEDKYLIEK